MNDGLPFADPLAGLYCPGCDYDLTGLTEHRCPECGEPFDPQALRTRLDTNPRPIEPWHSLAARHGEVAAYFRTAFEVIRGPTRFGASFPRVCGIAMPFAFGMFSRLLAGLLIGVITAYLVPRIGGILVGAVWYGAVSLLFNLMLAGFARVVCRTRHAAPLDRYATWFCLMEFGTCFMPIAIAVVVVGMLLEHLVDPSSMLWRVIFRSLPTAVTLWWWVWVSRVIGARTTSARRLWVTWVGVPLCALASVVIVSLVAIEVW